MAKNGVARKKGPGGKPISTKNKTEKKNEPVKATPKYETFSGGDCNSKLPASDVVHEVTIQEFKLLQRTINDLPYPIILLEDLKLTGLVKGSKTPVYRTKTATWLSARNGPVTKIELMGGVPLHLALEQKVNDLFQPAFIDVSLSDLDAVLSDRTGSILVSANGKKMRVPLDSAARASLAVGKPAIVASSQPHFKGLIRLLPGSLPHTAVRQQEYIINDLASFLARPVLKTPGGVEHRVKLTAPQIKELRVTGGVTMPVMGTSIVLRHSSPLQAASSALQASTAPLLSSTPTRPQSENAVLDPVQDEKGFELALHLAWKQQWHLKGYTRGQLLYSLTLGPQEETVIEVSSWDRRKQTTDESTSTDVEMTTEFTDTNKDVFGVLNELKQDNQFSVDTKFSAGIKLGDVVNLQGHAGTGFKTALADSSRTSLDNVHEAVLKTSSKLKIDRQIKVGESVEIGREEKVTRRVKNPNMCHTLTLNYFETLAHYTITTELDAPAARLCVLLSSPYGPSFTFSKQNIRLYEGVLRQVLLQPELGTGFAAAHKLVAVDELASAQILLKSQNPEPLTPISAGPLAVATTEVSETISAVKKASHALKTAAITKKLFMGHLVGDTAEEDGFRRKVFYRLRLKELAPGLYSALFLDETLDAKTLSRALSDITSLDQISRDQMNQPGAAITRIFEIAGRELGAGFGWNPGDAFLYVDDAGLVGALKNFKNAYAKLIQAQAMDSANKGTENARSAPPPSYSAKEIGEAIEQLDALLGHLNEYRRYYLSALVKLLPLNDQLLNSISRLSNLAERRVLGEIDGKIAIPLRADLDPRTKLLFTQLVSANPALTGLSDSFEISLPTSGLHVETRLGGCDACEPYVQSLRELDLLSREADLKLKQEKVNQEKVETSRYEARLKARKLSDPEDKAGIVRVALEGEEATALVSSLTSAKGTE